MAKLTTIEGIGEALAKKLKDKGIGSTNSLLKKGATKQGRMAISQGCGIDEGRILKFVNHADLMRIKGVGGEYAEILEAAGVDSVPELARRNASNLASAMASVNASKKLVRAVPTEKRVADWVAQAAKLDRIVGH
jgi:predicted flap endonuclease-1-like 5' DNA nuclease